MKGYILWCMYNKKGIPSFLMKSNQYETCIPKTMFQRAYLELPIESEIEDYEVILESIKNDGTAKKTEMFKNAKQIRDKPKVIKIKDIIDKRKHKDLSNSCENVSYLH